MASAPRSASLVRCACWCGAAWIAAACGCAHLAHASSATQEEAPRLALSVSLNKDVYALGEPVVVSLLTANNGASEVVDEWFSYPVTLGFSLERDGKFRVPMHGMYGVVSPRLTRWKYALPPKETISTAVDLTRGDIIEASPFFHTLASRLDRTEGRTGHYVTSPGTYVLTAHCSLPKHLPDGSRIRLKGSATFTVRAARGAEAEALALFEAQPYLTGRNPLYHLGGRNPEKSQRDALAAYQRVWNEYRNTPYAPYALYYTARLLQHRGQNREAAAKYELLLHEVPKFPLLADLLYYLALAQRDSGQTPALRETALRLRKEFRNHLVAPDVQATNPGSRIRILLAQLGLDNAP